MKRLLFLIPILLTAASPLHAQPYDLARTLQELPPHTPARVTVPPGIYRIPPSGISLENLRDVVIEGHGVTLIGTAFDNYLLSFRNCHNVRLDGFTIDYDPLPFTQGTVTALNPATRSVDFALHDGYPSLTPAYIHRKQLHVFSPETKKWKPGVGDIYPIRFQILSPRLGRAFLTPRDFPLVQVGDLVALNIRTSAIINQEAGCRDIEFRDIVIHSGPGGAFRVRLCENGGTLRGVQVRPGPTPAGGDHPRLLSTCADAVNMAHTRQGPTITGCTFIGMGDDGINLHGPTMPVLKTAPGVIWSGRPGSSTESMPWRDFIRPGDRIRLLQSPLYDIVGQTRIRTITESSDHVPEDLRQAIEKNWPRFRGTMTPTIYKIELEDETLDLRAAAFFDLPDLACETYSITDSRFENHRGYGTRIMASQGEIARNTFRDIRGSAIIIGPFYQGWREAGWVSHLRVIDNVIENVITGASLRPDSAGLGAITIHGSVDYAAAPAPITHYPGNQHILIAGNTITRSPAAAIHISAARDVILRDNTITHTLLTPFPEAGHRRGLSIDGPITIQSATATTETPPSSPDSNSELPVE